VADGREHLAVSVEQTDAGGDGDGGEGDRDEAADARVSQSGHPGDTRADTKNVQRRCMARDIAGLDRLHSQQQP